MGKVIVGMTMSLDGFINDQHGSVAALYADFEALQDSEPMREAIRDTGAAVMGANTFRMAEDPDLYADNYEFQVPIFVVTHTAPDKHPRQNDNLTFTFVTDGLASALAQAKAAAGERDVTVVGGASTIQQIIWAGLFDELHVDVMPVLLGGGVKLFEGVGGAAIQLERVKVIELPDGRTHLRYRGNGPAVPLAAPKQETQPHGY